MTITGAGITLSVNSAVAKEARQEVLREWVTHWFVAHLNHNLSFGDVIIVRRDDYDEIKVFVPAHLMAQAKAQTYPMEQELSEAGLPALVYVRQGEQASVKK